MKGGFGNDSFVVDNPGDRVFDEGAAVLGGIDTVFSAISFDLSSPMLVGVDIENLTLTGTGAINGIGNALNNILRGNSANNVVDGRDGVDLLIGGLGNDTYILGSGPDTVIDAGGTADLATSTIGRSMLS